MLKEKLLVVVKNNMSNNTIKEDILHKNCIILFELKYSNKGVILHHSPNENPRGQQIQMICYNKKMKARGRLTGFPDLILFFNNKVLLIELKREKGGVLSTEQKELFKKFQQQQFPVHIIKTLEDFDNLVADFILNVSS